MNLKHAILIAGPTASGKSAFGLKLAEALDGVIINADSMQVYRELRILSARPSVAEEAMVPHRLYGFLAGDQPCSAAFWAEQAMQAVEEAWAEGRTPIVLGGTGLYFKILLNGIAHIPDVDPVVRSDIRRDQQEKGAAFLHSALSALDPVMAERLNPADGQRVARALEVIKSTGVSLATWHERTEPGPLSTMDKTGGVVKYILDMPREQLYARCDQRYDLMMEAGALQEVEVLLKMGYGADMPVMKSLGVPSITAFLKGEIGADESALEAKMLTRRFAKRQLTWFRNQFPDWGRVHTQDIESYTGAILNDIVKNRG